MENFTSPEDNISLGKILNQARLDKNLSINDLSIITKIHKTLIFSLENNEIQNLPNRIYVLGFLKSISSILKCDYKKCVYLYELSLKSLTENNHPEEKIIEEVPEKVVPINLFAQTKFIKVKWLVVCSIFLVILLIVSPIFVQLDNIQSKRETDAHKLVLKKISIDKPIKKITMARPVVKPSSFNVSIIANQGVSWISFQVDKNPTRKITLKKGSSIILKGESIKLVLGNYKALIIKNNKEEVSFKKNIIGDVAKINFPQVENDFSPAQKLIFTLENKVNDQTQRL